MIGALRSPRWVAAVLVLGLAVAYALLVHPLWVAPWREVEADIAQLQQRQARINAQLAQGTVLAERMQALEQALLGRPGLLPETSEGLAVAGLVRRLEAAVQAADPGGRSCAINDRSPLPVTVEGRFAQVAVQVRLRCGTPELGSVLDQLENGAPRLFVEELDIQAQRYAAGAGESGQGLDAGFRLIGYMPAAVPERAPPAGAGP